MRYFFYFSYLCKLDWINESCLLHHHLKPSAPTPNQLKIKLYASNISEQIANKWLDVSISLKQHTQHCRWTSLITSLLRNSTLAGSLLQICEAAATIIFIIFSITEQIWQHQIEFFFTKNPAPSSGSQQKVSETDGRGCTCRISYCKTDGPVANFWTNSISKSTYYLTNIPCRTP